MNRPANRPGTVYLVGAGPGDPGLLTLRAAECLGLADFVLYDTLVNPALLQKVSSGARLRRLAEPGPCESLSREEVVSILVAEARAGNVVVRLKGGDPFVFGRGGEEAEALKEAGIPFEVVPAPTAGIAAPAYAGIPVTHRRWASAVALITGHEDPSKPDRSLDWEALARFPGTLVFYMAMGRVGSLTAALRGAGRAATTPAAAISWGTMPNQQTVLGTLGDLADRVAEADLTSPAVIVVGEVARLHEELAWFEHRPLFGRRVVVTRPRGQSVALIARLQNLGAEAIELPTIRIEPPADWTPVDAAIERLSEYDWLVFTSANGVCFLLDRLLERSDLRRLGSLRLAAIGPGTASALASYHLRADLVPEQYVAEALAEALAPHVAERRVLLARADRGREVLERLLSDAGAQVERLTVYRNLDETHPDSNVLGRIERGEVDWITLTSSAITRSLCDRLDEQARSHLGRKIKLASISPVTSKTARELGLEITVEARDYTADGVVDALVEYERGGSDG